MAHAETAFDDFPQGFVHLWMYIDLYAFVWGIQMKTEDGITWRNQAAFHPYTIHPSGTNAFDAEKKGMQRVRDAVGERLRRSKHCTCL